VLFDGTCTFCNGAVHFIIDRERNGELQFAPVQSEPARALLERAAGPERARVLVEGATGSGSPDTVVLVENGELYTHSTAALRIARRLRAPWSLVTLFVVVPRFIRDAVYRWFARHRYQWFGREDSCRVPTPELRARFLA